MKYMTLEENARRIKNINAASIDNKEFTFRHRVENYAPGQATYNLGDYPAKFSMYPTEYDFELVKDLAGKGIGIIQIHEEWNDAIRRFGADKYSSFDPEGLKKFVELCHSFDIKVIPYISSGYFQFTDPDYRDDFVRGNYDLRGSFWYYKKCWAGSASWRNYLLPKTFQAIDEYGFDGIYNDWGYDGLNICDAAGMGTDSVTNFPYDPEIEDLLCLIYNEVKRRGGIYKLHADRNNAPNCLDRVYDYLWIGEGISKRDYGIGKNYRPYVVPCRHMACMKDVPPDVYYAMVIPFMQFPLLKTGRPLTGIGCFEDVPLYLDKDKGDFGFFRRVNEYYQAHKDGPYVYSIWSSIPDDVEEYPRWAKYFKLYRPMVTQSSVVYVELRKSFDILSAIPNDVYISMFVNESKYLVASNLTDSLYRLVLRDEWKDRQNKKTAKVFDIEKGQILFLVLNET